MESARLCCYVGSITSMRGLKMVRKPDKYIYHTHAGMLEAWLEQNASWNVVGMCAMAKHPCSSPCDQRGCSPRRETSAHLTGRMCLFENSIPIGVLFMGEFLHTHTTPNPACPSLNRFAPREHNSFFPSIFPSALFLGADWSLLICDWVNGERCSLLQLSVRPPRLWYLWCYVEVRGSLFFFQSSNALHSWLFKYFFFLLLDSITSSVLI